MFDKRRYGARETCDQEQVKMITRTASSAYFPQMISVLSIPDPGEELRKRVEQVWDFVGFAPNKELLPQLMLNPLVKKPLESFSHDDIWNEIRRRQLGVPVEVPEIRETEWRALQAAPFEKPGDHPKPNALWFARRLNLELPGFLDRVVLVHHLREVRAQVGFTRIYGTAGNAEGEYQLDAKTAALGLDVDWIPAVQIHGEGVFLGFDLEALGAWEKRQAVKDRASQFRDALFEFNKGRKNQIPETGPRLVMLHSLAHMLITSISLECGYPATSIRERIYCSEDGDERAGILLYTGTPGSEGTLGGLVEIGREILHHLRNAAEMSRLCSNDPVCAQHQPGDHQEGRHREGAACHGCLLIGEPSCERMNRDLDRTLVVPTVENAEAAFLKDWMASWETTGLVV